MVLLIYLWVAVLAFGAVGSSLIDRRIVVLLVAGGLVFALVVTRCRPGVGSGRTVAGSRGRGAAHPERFL